MSEKRKEDFDPPVKRGKHDRAEEDYFKRKGMEDCMSVILKNLSLEDRKNLCLVDKYMYFKVKTLDNDFKTWIIDLKKTDDGKLPVLPDFVLDSPLYHQPQYKHIPQTGICFNVPDIKDDDDGYLKQLKDLLEHKELQPRMINDQVIYRLKGLYVDVADLDKVKKYFHFPALKILLLKHRRNAWSKNDKIKLPDENYSDMYSLIAQASENVEDFHLERFGST